MRSGTFISCLKVPSPYPLWYTALMRRESISEHLNGFEQDIMSVWSYSHYMGRCLTMESGWSWKTKKCRNNFFQKQDFIHSCGLVLQVPTLT